MSQQDGDTRTRLLARIKTAILRLNDSDTPDDATLALLIPYLESAADIAQSSRPRAAGHFLSFLQEPKPGQGTEATTAPMDHGPPSDEDIHGSAPQSDQTPAQPPADAVPAASNAMPPCTAESPANKESGETSWGFSKGPDGDREIAQLWAGHKARNMETLAKSGCIRPPYDKLVKQIDSAHSQAAPLGTPSNPIGGSMRSRPY